MTFVNSQTIATGSPVFDYSSRDYSSIITDLLNRIPVYLPEWTSTSASDFGVVLMQEFAYMGDILGYYLDRLAGEAFIQTATQPSSIINLASMLGYTPFLSSGSSTYVTVTIGTSVVGPVTIPFGTQFATQATPTTPPIVFQTTQTATIAGASGSPPSFAAQIPVVQALTYTSLPMTYGVIDVWAEFNVPSTAVVVPPVAVSSGVTNQTYPLLYNPVSANSFSVYVDLGLGPQEWNYVTSLISSGPSDQVYTNYVDANGIFYAIFGDGVNGYVPPLGSPIYALYQTNVGSVGNVGPGTITNSVTGVIGVTSVNNQQGAEGGAEAESTASIQVNAPASLRTLHRAITIEDINTLAVVAGVQWASAVEQTYQLIDLYVAPKGGGVPNPIIQASVLNFLVPLLMPNTTVTIFPPSYVPINMTVQLVVGEVYGNTTTQALVQNALTNLLALSNTGFGFRVALGLIYETILAQLGVEYAIVSSLTRGYTAVLTVPLAPSTSYTGLTVSRLPQDVYGGDVLTVANSCTVILTSPLDANTVYTALDVSALYQPVTAGDSLVLTAPNGGVQIVQASTPAATGATIINITAFTTGFLYPTGSFVYDETASPNTQTSIVVSGSPGAVVATAGSTNIPVESFTTPAATSSFGGFPTGSFVQDGSGTNDCVMLESEIPVLGNITFYPPPTGGLIGS